MRNQYVNAVTSETLEVKRSKFITYLMPFSKFDEVMARLKEEHPKARHFVYAYRFINEFEQIVENLSDDGEPKGSSGKPTLAAIRGAELVNSAVIVVRYFGGIKLGVGGLVRAYSDATNNAINSADLLVYKKLVKLELDVTYSNLGKVEHALKHFDITEIGKEFLGDKVILRFRLPEEDKGKLIEQTKDFSSLIEEI